MSRVNEKGYIERKRGGNHALSRKWLNWYLIQPSQGKRGILAIGTITFPEELVGKRIRLKVEVLC